MITMNFSGWRITFRQSGNNKNSHRLEIVDIIAIGNNRQHVIMNDPHFHSIKNDLSGNEFIELLYQL